MQEYMAISFSHKVMDLSLREKLAFENDEIIAFLHKACGSESIKEALLLSTCNRIDFYASVSDSKKAQEEFYTILESCKKVPLALLKKHSFVRLNQYAVYHIFSVASSLDSLVIGETQITGQLKDAYRLAHENMFCAKDMMRIMHHAFKCAAKVRNSIDISSSHTSVAGAAVAMLQERLLEQGESLDSKQVAILGAGEMGILALKHLCKYRLRVILLNRNTQKATQTLQELQTTLKTQSSLEVKPFSYLKDALNECDIFLSATGAPHIVVDREMIQKSDKKRIWFDLAVPRDIESVEVENLQIYCVDDLQEIILQNKAQRESRAKEGQKIVEEFVQDFFKWLQSLGAEPIIKHIRALAKDSSLKELERAVKKGFLPKEYEKNVEKILHGAFNTFLHKPTMRLKEAGESINADPILEAAKNIFDIADDIVLLNKYKCEEYFGDSQMREKEMYEQDTREENQNHVKEK